jgi:hypothetical protein
MIEHVGSFISDIYRRCDQRIVRVDTGCLLVIITGTNLCDIFDFIIPLSGNQAKLGMYLHMIQTIDYAASGILKLSRPADVILLIKTCPEFN